MPKSKDVKLGNAVLNYIGYAINRSHYYKLNKNQDIVSCVPKDGHVNTDKFNIYDAFIAMIKRALKIADDDKYLQKQIRHYEKASDQDIKLMESMDKSVTEYKASCAMLEKSRNTYIKKFQHYLDVARDTKDNTKLQIKLAKSNDLLAMDKSIERINQRSTALKNRAIKINKQASEKLQREYQRESGTISANIYSIQNIIDLLPANARDAKTRALQLLNIEKKFSHKISNRIKDRESRAIKQRQKIANLSLSINHDHLKHLMNHKN